MARFSETAQPQNFVGQHHVHFPLPDGRTFVNVTGVVIIQARGDQLDQPAHGGDWGWEDYGVSVKFPPGIAPPPDKVFEVLQHAPLITLNGVSNDNRAVNAGFSVNKFQGLVGKTGGLVFEFKVALRDGDGYLNRVGYSLTAVLGVADPAPIL